MSIVSNVSNSCAPAERNVYRAQRSNEPMNPETEKWEGIFNVTTQKTQGKTGEGGKTAYRGGEVPSPNFGYGAARGIANSLKFQLL